MASIVEMANAEADEVEAENPDEETPDFPDEATPDESPSEQPEPEPEITEAQLRRAEKAIEAQKKRVADILGASFVAHDCPLCQALGFMPDLPPPGSRLEFQPGEDGATLAILPPETPPELLHAPDKATCDECDGWGEVVTGSRNPNGATWQCSKCNGNGWMQVARPQPVYQVPAPTTSPGGAFVPDANPQLPPDAWGRPQGHQHYGIPPASVGS